MTDKVTPGPMQELGCIREAVCIHTNKILDSCRAKDCIEDLRFFPTQNSQAAIDRALSIKAGQAELLYVYIDVEPVGFHRGFYAVDVRYFYRITADAFVGAARPIPICGLAVFDKRAVLFGSESTSKTFTSLQNLCDTDEQELDKCNLPTAVVEAVDPIVLGIKLVDVCECRRCDCELTEIPPCVCALFGSDLCFGNSDKRVYISLGQFSIIRLERDTQLLVPVYDYCMPEKECCGGSGDGPCDDDPCDLFRQVQFPTDAFFPPAPPPSRCEERCEEHHERCEDRCERKGCCK
ncbi:MAG: hypothetical protein RR949_03330 [Oscillospiraceae bacterium]